jgi:A/G-specific adenine glycosylase
LNSYLQRPLPQNSTVSYLNKNAPDLRKKLAAWFERNKRDLPWRRLASLYPTVVSEFMLQQTQVKTVLPFFDRWLKRFPDFPSLARAKEATVLKHWEGLGYYSRARNLHQLAKDITALDSIPEDPEGWQQFKGIGAYTAAAITSITFQYPAACVDGNVIRILARLTADQTVFKDNSQAMQKLGPLAQTLLDPKHPGRHNEAMMELGATICTKGKPSCNICPLAGACQSKDHDPESLPRKPARKIKQETIDRAWIIHEGRLLLHRANGSSKRLSGILELPALALLDNSAESPREKRYTLLATRRRGISNSQITEHIWQLAAGFSQTHADCEWIDLDQIHKATLSGPHKRWISEILKHA